MNKNPSRGIYIPTTIKVHPIYEKGHPYYENVHPFYEKRTSQLRVKYILTTSKEVRKCKFFILGGLFLLYELYFSKTAEEDILVYPQSFTPFILVLHQCSPLKIKMKGFCSLVSNILFCWPIVAKIGPKHQGLRFRLGPLLRTIIMFASTTNLQKLLMSSMHTRRLRFGM